MTGDEFGAYLTLRERNLAEDFRGRVPGARTIYRLADDALGEVPNAPPMVVVRWLAEQLGITAREIRAKAPRLVHRLKRRVGERCRIQAGHEQGDPSK
jgi:hypothetical protein